MIVAGICFGILIGLNIIFLSMPLDLKWTPTLVGCQTTLLIGKLRYQKRRLKKRI